MKRAGALLTAMALIIAGAASCDAPKYRYEVRKDLSVYFSNADSVIQSMREAFRERCPEISVEYTSHGDSMDDIPAVMSELVKFAMSETDDPCEGDYMYHQYGGYSLEYSRTDGADSHSYTVKLIPEYYTDAGQEEQVTGSVRSILAELQTGGMTEAERVRAIYDYVYENVKYDKVHAKNPHYHLKTTAYAALFNGCAVCQGFSVLMYRLLREAGINARVITGTAVNDKGSEYHAWNIAEIGGKYYNIDITWDVQRGTHDYFLKSDSSFSADHIRDSEYQTEDFYEKYPMSDKDMYV